MWAADRVSILVSRFFCMTYAQRIAAAHGRIRSKFGTDASGAQLYVWHNNVQIHAYQPSGKNGRNLMAQIIVKDDTVSVIATKAQFATVYAKPHGKPQVDTYVTEVSQDTWIFFPWDMALQYVQPFRGTD